MVEEFGPIETAYRGYRFRSRLEARWAVAFDTLGLRWEYEPEGFDLPGGYYLPDFLVENQAGHKDWWEVKPERLERPAAPVVDLRWVDLVRATGRCLFVAFGIFEPKGPGDWDLWLLDQPDGPGELRLTSRGLCSPAAEWTLALAAARSARFEHHDTDPTAQPRDHMQRAAGDR